MKTEQEYAAIFARNLAIQIDRSQLNQSQLSEILGVSRATVSDWVKGKIQPRLPMFFRLCDVLGCDPNTMGGFHPGETSKAAIAFLDAYMEAPRPIQEAADALLAPYKKGVSVG